MGQQIIDPPEGFVLDMPAPPDGFVIDDPSVPQPPAGFVIDQPSGLMGGESASIQNARPYSLWGKIKDTVSSVFRESPEEAAAKFENIAAIHAQTKIPLPEVYKRINDLSRDPAITGIRPGTLTNEEYSALVFAPLVGQAIWAAPLTAPLTIAGFSALDKVVNLKNFLPSDASDTSKTAVELADFIVKGVGVGAAMKGVIKGASPFIEKYFQTKVNELKLPEKFQLTSEQIRDIFQTGTKTTAEQQGVLAGLGLTREAMKTALKDGLIVEVPAERIMRMVDKPGWAAFKKAFKIPEAADMFSKDPLLREMNRNRSTSETVVPEGAYSATGGAPKPPAGFVMEQPAALPAPMTDVGPTGISVAGTPPVLTPDQAVVLPTTVGPTPEPPAGFVVEKWYHGGTPGLTEVTDGFATRILSEAEHYAKQYKNGVVYEVSPEGIRPATQKDIAGNVYGDLSKIGIIRNAVVKPIQEFITPVKEPASVPEPVLPKPVQTKTVNGRKLAYFKVKVGQEWKTPVGQAPKVKPGSELNATGPGVINKKNNSEITIQKIHASLEDVKVEYKGDYAIISGYPKGEGYTGPSGYGLGGAATTSGTIDTAEQLGGIPGTPSFKLSTEIHTLVKKYAERFGENYLPKGVAGYFFTASENIFVSSKNNIRYASHEITHFLNKRKGFTQTVTRTIGHARNGNPIYDSATKDIRKILTEIYVKHYFGGKADHPLKKRVEEGISTFFERFIMYPQETAQDYPLLISEFINPGGQYFDSHMQEFIRDAQTIIKKYQGLDPLHQISSRVKETDVLGTKPYLTIQEKLIAKIFDDVYPIEKLGKEYGEHFTSGDPSLYVRMFRYLPRIIQHNLSDTPIMGLWPLSYGAETYLGFDNSGEIQVKYDFNWHTLVRSTEDIEGFNAWLVARKALSDFNEMDTLQSDLNVLETNLKDLKTLGGSPSDIREAILAVEEKKEALKTVSDIVTKDAFDKSVVTSAVNDNAQRFQASADMFDKLVRADLDLLHNPRVQLISNEFYQELIQKKGYTTLKRDIWNEVVGNPEGPEKPTPRMGGGKGKVSSMLRRTGSQKDVISPIYASMFNHQEILKKASRQMVWNTIASIALKNPTSGLFQPLKLISAPQPNGMVIYPQDKDPNIMMGRKDGKRIPILMNKELKDMVDNMLTPASVGWVEKGFTYLAQVFTKGTTGVYPPFLITNIMIDQLSANSYTWTKYKAIITPIKELTAALSNSSSPGHKFLAEYLMLGGTHQLFLQFADMDPKEAYDFMRREVGVIEKTKEIINAGLDIASSPVQASELMTRSAEYIRARKLGYGQWAALELAGRVSVPFHHKGDYGQVGRFIIRSIPYFKASLQVLAQTGRAVHDPKTRNRVLFIMSVISAAMVAGILAILNSGTDDQKELLKSIPPEELGRYTFWPHPDGERLLKYRVPQEYSTIATITNMMILDAMAEAKYKPYEYLKGATNWLPDQINPTEPARMLLSWIPQAISPTLQVITNTRFYPRVRPLEPDYMKYIPKEERTFENTSNLSKWVAPKIGLSPIQMDALMEGYSGRAIKFVTGKENANPLIREFYFTSGRQMMGYYAALDKNTQDMARANDPDTEMSSEEYNKIKDNDDALKDIKADIKEYREKVKTKSDSDKEAMRELRTKILDGIDTLK